MRRAIWFILVGVLGAGCGDLLNIPSSEVYDGDGAGSSGGGTSMWGPGFVPLGGLGGDCTAALALGSAASSAFQQLSFIPCASGAQDCWELAWDGKLTWDPTGSGDDLLVFDVQFVYGADGQVTRLLVRHHYPIGANYGPNPYEAVLYDLPTGTPLAAIRNVSVDCFVVPVASADGLWLVGAPSQSAAVVAAYEPVSSASGSTTVVLETIPVNTTFLQNQALAFDDRLALSQNDGKIVVVQAAGGRSNSTYGPGPERVWLSALIGDRFLTIDPQASPGPQYFTLDRSMQSAAYGAANELSTDGTHAAYSQAAGGGISLYSVSPSDGTSDAGLLATIPAPPSNVGTLVVVQSAMGDGAYALVTDVDLVGSGQPANGLAVTVVDLISRTVGMGQGPWASTADSQLLFVGYTRGFLWFGETGSLGGVSKILRVAAPGG